MVDAPGQGSFSGQDAARSCGCDLLGSSSGGHAAPSTGSGAPVVRQTIRIGVLTDLTGLAAVLGCTTEEGIKAGVGFARQQGYDIKYFLADTGSTPSGALTGARALVQLHRVFALVLLSQLGFAASTYLTQQGIPVVRANGDGPEWLHSRNMFSILGFGDYARVIITHGHIFEALAARSSAASATGSSRLRTKWPSQLLSQLGRRACASVTSKRTCPSGRRI